MTVFCLFFILARCASFVSWCGSKDYCAVTFPVSTCRPACSKYFNGIGCCCCFLCVRGGGGGAVFCSLVLFYCDMIYPPLRFTL